jgi:hypothetical protein
MRDVDFDDLRSHVENNTYLPEFQEVQKRARRVKRRHRLRALIAVAAVTVPAVAATDAFYHAGQAPEDNTVAITGDGSVVHLTMPTEKVKPDTWTLVAADGVDLEHMFGLVDVCSGRACELEISSIDPGGILGTTQRIELFRTTSTDLLTDTRVVAVDSDTVIISARVNGGPPQSQTLRLTAMPTSERPPAGGRAIQPAENGDIQVATSKGTSGPLLVPPPLTSPQLASTISGWWVAGMDPNTGSPTLAVSRDTGKSWSTRPMGMNKVDAPPSIVEQNNVLYLLASSNSKMTLQKSSDDGQTWTPLPAATTWPKSARYGLVTAHDKSLIAWISTSSGTVLLRSKDAGATFVPYRNPGASTGPIVAVPGGYLMLGSKPALSHDGVTWANATIPWLPLR